MSVPLGFVHPLSVFQILQDGRCNLKDISTRKPVESLDKVARFIQRGYHSQIELLTQGEVLFSTAGGDVYDTSSLLTAYFFPGNNPVFHPQLGLQFVKRPLVGKSYQPLPGYLLYDFVFAL